MFNVTALGQEVPVRTNYQPIFADRCFVTGNDHDVAIRPEFPVFTTIDLSSGIDIVLPGNINITYATLTLSSGINNNFTFTKIELTQQQEKRQNIGLGLKELAEVIKLKGLIYATTDYFFPFNIYFADSEIDLKINTSKTSVQPAMVLVIT